jgi:hypothetical protein
VTPAAAAPALRGLVGYDRSLDDEILRFNREGHPHRRADWVEPRWRWMFLASASRLGVRPMVWMFRGTTGIVAHQGGIPVRLRVDRQEMTTGWFVETMVLESHRGKAIGPMVVKKALEDLPLNLSLGQTEAMRTLQFALGWVQVAPLDEYVLVLNPAAAVQGKVPGPVAPLAAALLSAAGRLRAWRRGRVASRLAVRPIERFGAAHDRLWERVRDRFGCAVVRDASYLNWKYVDQPGQSFTRLEVVRDGEPLALIVVTTRPQEPPYAYRRGFIVELVADPVDRPSVMAGLDAGCAELARQGAALVRFDLIGEALAAHARAYGFRQHAATRFLLVATGGAAPDVASRMTDPRAWLVTMGDSDIDRPW